MNNNTTNNLTRTTELLIGKTKFDYDNRYNKHQLTDDEIDMYEEILTSFSKRYNLTFEDISDLKTDYISTMKQLHEYTNWTNCNLVNEDYKQALNDSDKLCEIIEDIVPYFDVMK